MITYTAVALATLARAYEGGTDIGFVRLGLVVAGHDKLFTGLIAGKDCTTASAERASDFFDLCWPAHVQWPREVVRRPIELLYGKQIGRAEDLVEKAKERKHQAISSRPTRSRRKSAPQQAIALGE